MKISGFSFVRNGIKLYYPVVETIKSILPLVDEFVIAVGKGDKDDTSRKKIEEINSPKIRIIDTVWDIEKFPRGMEHAHQTDIAKNACIGDWLFYLQGDEVIHEKDLSIIHSRCEQLLNKSEVEGMLFKYLHFWGDYEHYHKSHGWYPYEIRIIRNDPDIHSWESAQSFRRIPHFDGVHYRQQENPYKLKVALIDAYVYHYGWVRPPHLMQNKRRYFHTNHWGSKRAKEHYDKLNEYFDYGPLDQIEVFQDTHPAVMEQKLSEFDWQEKLQFSGKPNTLREKYKHEKLRNKILTWFENHLNKGNQIGYFKNFILLDV